MHKCTRGCDDHCSRDVKKMPVFYWLQASAMHACMEAMQEKRTFPHIEHKKRIHRQKRRLKRGCTVTDVVNIISSQRFSADSSLNFMDMKFGGKHSSSMLRAEFKLFRISKPKFSETFRRPATDNIHFLIRQWKCHIIMYFFKKVVVFPFLLPLKYAKALRNNK